MANTAALDGIGAALSAFGQVYGNYKQEERSEARDLNKQKLVEKLRREAEIAAEQRAAARYDVTKVEEGDTPGVFWEVKYNKSGDEMERTLASKSAIEDIKLTREKNRLGLDKLILDNETARTNLEALPEELALDRRYKESQINYNNDRGLASVLRADGTNKPAKPVYTPSSSEISNALIEDYEAPIKELGLTESDARRVANAVALELIQQAKAGTPKDPGDTMLKALNAFKSAGVKNKRYGE